MVQLNSKGEVADFVNESQFESGESAYECVAFSAALIKYAGAPGKGPTGTGEQVDQAADFWYGKEEGDYSASNTNGMSLDALYMMLRGMFMPFKALTPTLTEITRALQQGYPVIVCGAETGMHDLDLGGAVPYSWVPTGNHAIVACGLLPGNNLLVRDTASIAPSGVRPGPRRYDSSKLQLVSATAIIVPWEVSIVIDINTPGVSNYFASATPGWWRCRNAKQIHGKILEFYQSFGNAALCGITFLGLPETDEIPIDNSGATKQYFERGCLAYDPQHKHDNPPGSGIVYLAHVYGTGAIGEDPLIPQLQAQLAQAIAQHTGIDANAVKNRLQAIELEAQKVIQLATQAIV